MIGNPLSTKGFSLLEVLVAFVILALLLTVLFQLFSSSLRNAQLTEQYSHALLLAESKLARLGHDEPLAVGVSEGTFADSAGDSDYRWHLTVTPYHPEHIPLDLPLQALWVHLTVSWSSGRRAIDLSTLKLVPRPVAGSGS